MIWINSISQLDYYTEPEPCYCDMLMQPDDLILQGNLGASVDESALSLQALAMTADGLTVLGDILPYCSYFFAYTPTGDVYFNLRLNTFPPWLCAVECFIVHAIVPGYFDKYTQRYCMDSCCAIARNITITQDGISRREIKGDIPDITPRIETITHTCGRPMIQVKTVFDCFDNETGDFYGIADVITGSVSAGFAFYKITNVPATWRQLPRNINRTISQNCKVQKSTSTRQYEFQSFDVFPLWKMNELELMLHANHIIIAGTEYQWQGGTPFESVKTESPNYIESYKTKFRLQTTFEDCPIEQIFGCADNCEAQAYYFRLPNEAQRYFDDKGNAYTDAETLLRMQSGVKDVEDITATVPFPSSATYKVIASRTLSPIYADRRTSSNRIYGIKLSANSPDFERIYPTANRTPAPVIGQITVALMTTATPVIGTVTVQAITPIAGTISTRGGWVMDSGSIEASQGWATLSIDTSNDNYPQQQGDPLPFINSEIALISEAMRPRVDTLHTNADNAQIPAGSALEIRANGIVYWHGNPIAATNTGSQIILSNITYQL